MNPVPHADSFTSESCPGEQRHPELEPRRACVLRSELTADVATVDRLAEDGGFPERERLKPRERLDLTPAPCAVMLDELLLRREAGRRRHGRSAERAHLASGLAVRREQVADVRARVPDGAHLPVEDGSDARLARRDHHVAEPVVAVDDGERERLRQLVCEPGPDRLHVREVTRAVDLPQLGEAPDLPLEIAAGPHELRDAVRTDVSRVDLDQRVDEVERRARAARPPSRGLAGSVSVTTCPSRKSMT